jgi:hypothetical protein
MDVVRKFRDFNGVPAFQESALFEVLRSSPGALILSEPDAGLSTSEDAFLNNGAEVEGDVSPDALLVSA